MADDNGTNGSERRPTIRPESREAEGRFKKLKLLKSFAEVERRLRMGWSAPACAKMVQEEFNEYTDITRDSLCTIISEFASTIPPAEMGLAVGSPAYKRAAKKLNEGLDELDEIEKLYRMQMARLDIDIATEQKIKKLFPTTKNEVFIAMKLLNLSAQLKMDLGLVKRQLGTMEVNGQIAAEATERYGRDSVGKVLADPDSRRKVLQLAEKFAAFTTKAGVDTIDIGAIFMSARAADQPAAPGREVIDGTVVEPDPALPEGEKKP